MPLFRKRPVVIEARQFTEENQYATADWCHGRLRGASLPPEKRFIQIDTLEGEITARVGDWIIRGVQGEFYPCKQDIFAETYEPV